MCGRVGDFWHWACSFHVLHRHAKSESNVESSYLHHCLIVLVYAIQHENLFVVGCGCGWVDWCGCVAGVSVFTVSDKSAAASPRTTWTTTGARWARYGTRHGWKMSSKYRIVLQKRHVTNTSHRRTAGTKLQQIQVAIRTQTTTVYADLSSTTSPPAHRHSAILARTWVCFSTTDPTWPTC